MALEQTPCAKLGDVQAEGAVIEKQSIIKKSNCLAVGIQDTKLSSSFLSPNYCKQTSGFDQECLLSLLKNQLLFLLHSDLYKGYLLSLVSHDD